MAIEALDRVRGAAEGGMGHKTVAMPVEVVDMGLMAEME